MTRQRKRLVEDLGNEIVGAVYDRDRDSRAAYAAFARKMLPTLRHCQAAVGDGRRSATLANKVKRRVGEAIRAKRGYLAQTLMRCHRAVKPR